MKIVEPSVEIVQFPDNPAQLIEAAARTCYQSAPKGDSGEFVKRLAGKGHISPFEFASATVKILTDRGVMSELTRHRLASFNVESTRYVRYDTFRVIMPARLLYAPEKQKRIWEESCMHAEDAYMRLLIEGASPETARGVMPMCLATEVTMLANFREWMHIFKLRCSTKAHPDMRRIMVPLRDMFRERCCEIFGRETGANDV